MLNTPLILKYLNPELLTDDLQDMREITGEKTFRDIMERFNGSDVRFPSLLGQAGAALENYIANLQAKGNAYNSSNIARLFGVNVSTVQRARNRVKEKGLLS